ncbi:class I SAM-dependent methyltransferase [Falsiruegeria mediterranea]|uniref:Demethylmenaquinone methyltransferase n=1 Tax=Falsiruegeria mediterranea M17 TaxID=1200281 RepID=A0A2R8CAY8_9RHOB|nr:methyltransferase domain-containing protein [Falsiruegeria mediterranea]SPJ29601.1 Demethylmenaquinone methyltransferase [Falsiruegeria mediterranea M17]
MSTNAANFVGDIPHHYDTGLGPAIFHDYADRLVERCTATGATDVIEMAAGTGIVSRKLRDHLDPDAALTVTDLNAPMLDIAQSKFSEGENVLFQTADAMQLPFDDDSFDLMLCQFGVMFFPDKPASFREAKRVLRPGGRYVFNVWSAMSENPFSEVAHTVAASFFPDDPPGFYKVPFHYGDPDVVRADLAIAGWLDVEHLTTRIDKVVADPQGFATALVYGNPLIEQIRERGGVDPDEVADAMLSALQGQFGMGEMTMPLSATLFDCRMP